MHALLLEPANYRTIAHSTRDEWSQTPCLMTNLPAARGTTTLVEAIHPDAPNEAPSAVARTVVRTVVPTEDLGEGLSARDSGVVRCWCRRSRGCPSRPSPKV